MERQWGQAQCGHNSIKKVKTEDGGVGTVEEEQEWWGVRFPRRSKHNLEELESRQLRVCKTKESCVQREGCPGRGISLCRRQLVSFCRKLSQSRGLVSLRFFNVR